MEVPHRAVRAGSRHVERCDDPRGVEVPPAPRKDLRVACALEQYRSPADLEVHPGLDEEIRVVQPSDEARPGLDDVGVLGALGDDRDGDLVTADDTDQITEVGHGDDDLEWGRVSSSGLQRSERARDDDGEPSESAAHDHS
jgi:hypothetical protein